MLVTGNRGNREVEKAIPPIGRKTILSINVYVQRFVQAAELLHIKRQKLQLQKEDV